MTYIHPEREAFIPDEVRYLTPLLVNPPQVDDLVDEIAPWQRPAEPSLTMREARKVARRDPVSGIDLTRRDDR